jgi:hypothetical protein
MIRLFLDAHKLYLLEVTVRSTWFLLSAVEEIGSSHASWSMKMGTKTIVELIFAILMALSLHGDVDQQAKNGHRSGLISDSHRSGLISDSHRSGLISDSHRSGLISDSHRSGPISDSHVVSKAVVDGESSSMGHRPQASPG